MKKSIFFLCLFIAIISCQKMEWESSKMDDEVQLKIRSAITPDEAFLDFANEQLSVGNSNIILAQAEYITMDPNSDKTGRRVFYKVLGNRQLNADFVPFDQRRTWSGNALGNNDNITYAIDQVDAATDNGVPAEKTTQAIEAAMETWRNAKCSELVLTRIDNDNKDIGVLTYYLGMGGSPDIVADVMHTGFTDFRLSRRIIAITFTYIFTAEGTYTDINNDGKYDVAYREIYYNPVINWGINEKVDIETIALHENGHALSQAHFGSRFITNKNGKIHYAARAVMNPSYSGIIHELTATDVGGHCSIWSNWPHQ